MRGGRSAAAHAPVRCYAAGQPVGNDSTHRKRETAGAMTDTTEQLDGLDPFDSGLDLQHERLARLRAQCPVAHLPTGQYFFTRYDDVHEILRDGGERIRHFTHEGGMRAPGVV